MGANVAGIYGAQIFREDDKPRYRRGFSVNIAVLTVGLLLAVVRYVDDMLRRRRNSGQLSNQSASADNSHDEDELKKVAPPSDSQPYPVLIGSDPQPVIQKMVR